MGVHPVSLRRSRASGSRDSVCGLPGCAAPCFTDDRGFQHDYCGRTHATLARQRGLVPASAAGLPPEWVSRIFRGRAGTPPYALSEITNQHPKYAGVKSQFCESWAHPTPVPTVLRVFQVRNAMDVLARYEACKAELEQQPGGAREERRFHGTSLGRCCSFGSNLAARPCEDSDCAVCAIASRSFDFSLPTRFPNRALRYGQGGYFSRHSSKSNDYADASDRGGVRVMFLAKVLLGRVHETKQEYLADGELHFILKGRGGQHDSIRGLTRKDGGLLNFEENVIYKEEHALPSYLIVYRLSAAP